MYTKRIQEGSDKALFEAKSHNFREKGGMGGLKVQFFYSWQKKQLKWLIDYRIKIEEK